MGLSWRLVALLLAFLLLLTGCIPREGSEGDNTAPSDAPEQGEQAGGGGAADDPSVSTGEGESPQETPEETAPAEVPRIENAPDSIVYPDGALRRIYPEDYRLGALATAETRGPAIDAVRRFLIGVIEEDVDSEMLLPDSRFMILETLSRHGMPEVEAFRLGEPEALSPQTVAVPAVLFSEGRRGVTEVYIEYDDSVWYISEFPVHPGMYDRDGEAIQPAGLFDPRSPQL